MIFEPERRVRRRNTIRFMRTRNHVGRFLHEEVFRDVDEDGNEVYHRIQYVYDNIREHNCTRYCRRCLANRNTKTYQDIGGLNLDEMVDENHGELPENWFVLLKPKDRDYLVGLMEEKSDMAIWGHYLRRKRNEIRETEGTCHADCDTDVPPENLDN